MKTSFSPYPFGSPMPSRSFSASSYKYGYQGSEKDDELNGLQNAVTTYFRELDSRLGKWWSIDPKAKPWESPFVSMGNNPIWFNDIMGDEFDPKSQVRVDNFKSNTQAKIDANKIDIMKLGVQAQSLADNGKNNSKILAKIENLQKANSVLNSAITEVGILEASSQMYSINETGPGNKGGTSFDSKTGVITFNVLSGNDANLAHELKHGFQFEMGTNSFDYLTGGSGLLYDIQDEQEAYERQLAFGGLPAGLSSGINPNNIKKLDAVFGTEYSKAFNSAINISTSTTITRDLLNHHIGTGFDSEIGKNWGDFINKQNKMYQKAGKGGFDYIK